MSGIRSEKTFKALRELLGDFRYLEILPCDYDEAARFFNLCRAKGVTGSSIDLLICAVAHRYDFPIFTTDRAFERYARIIGLRLFKGDESSCS